jgi:hypothetical protein
MRHLSQEGRTSFGTCFKLVESHPISIPINVQLSPMTATLPFEALFAQNMSKHVSQILAFADFFDFI